MNSLPPVHKVRLRGLNAFSVSDFEEARAAVRRLLKEM